MSRWQPSQRILIQMNSSRAMRQRRSRDCWPQFYIRKKHDNSLPALRMQDQRETKPRIAPSVAPVLCDAARDVLTLAGERPILAGERRTSAQVYPDKSRVPQQQTLR